MDKRELKILSAFYKELEKIFSKSGELDEKEFEFLVDFTTLILDLKRSGYGSVNEIFAQIQKFIEDPGAENELLS